jgi:hypothetical protein
MNSRMNDRKTGQVSFLICERYQENISTIPGEDLTRLKKKRLYANESCKLTNVLAEIKAFSLTRLNSE